jgi:hypothetical protein
MNKCLKNIVFGGYYELVSVQMKKSKINYYFKIRKIYFNFFIINLINFYKIFQI